uniref:Uncharacterized protein n=1 Tax=Ixodes ricinus TaxID=34613 RepID=A0A6B0UN70_IXORI
MFLLLLLLGRSIGILTVQGSVRIETLLQLPLDLPFFLFQRSVYSGTVFQLLLQLQLLIFLFLLLQSGCLCSNLSQGVCHDIHILAWNVPSLVELQSILNLFLQPLAENGSRQVAKTVDPGS